MCGCELNSNDLGQGPAVGFCEYGNETLRFIKGGESSNYEDDSYLGYCVIVLIMEAVCAPETLVNFYRPT
jgi:hypothetical protein